MKKIIVSCSLILSTVLGYSQLNKGDRMIPINGSGERIDYAKGYYNGMNRHFGLQLNTGMAWFVARNFAIGPAIRLAYTSNKVVTPGSADPDLNNYTASDYTASGPTIGLGPMLRYYVPFGKSALFIHGAVLGAFTFENFKDRRRHESTETKFREVNAQIGLGYTYFISSNFGIEVLPAYEYLNRQFKNGRSDFRDLQENKRWSFNIGFQWYLNKSIATTTEVK